MPERWVVTTFHAGVELANLLKITSPLLKAKLTMLSLGPISRNLKMFFAMTNVAFKLVAAQAAISVLCTAGRSDTNEARANNSN